MGRLFACELAMRKNGAQVKGVLAMPRPNSQADLTAQSRRAWEALQAETGPLSAAEMTAPGTVGEWSVKDVLAHLTAWQQMVLGWYAAGKRGETPRTPSDKHTWAQIPALNQDIYEAHRDQPLDEVRAELAASHRQAMSLVESLDDAELFTPNVYAWTKTTTLGSYFTSALSSHYEWARKEIRKGLKAQRSGS
jgi:uncharacterized protein (TIGR03083 family)